MAAGASCVTIAFFILNSSCMIAVPARTCPDACLAFQYSNLKTPMSTVTPPPEHPPPHSSDLWNSQVDIFLILCYHSSVSITPVCQTRRGAEHELSLVGILHRHSGGRQRPQGRRTAFVSDQAISEADQKAGKELGARLFNRTRPQTITPGGPGALSLRRPDPPVKTGDADRNFENYADCRADTLRIGVSAMGQPPFLPALTGQFQLCRPDIRVELVPQPAGAAEFSGADLYFPPIPLDDRLEHVILRRDRVCVLVSEALLSRTYGPPV